MSETLSDSCSEDEKNRGGRIFTAWLATILLLIGMLSHLGFITPVTGEDGEPAHFGVWSLLPAFLAIFLAFWLRNVIVALTVGVFAGGLVSGQFNILKSFFFPAVGSEEYAMLLLVYLWALGGLIGIWTRTGGATHFANAAAKVMVRGRRSAKTFVWFMGLVFHQGGTVSTVLTGATVRSVGDRNRVSHEELSYVVDSTASPAAAIIPFNIWPLYIGSIVAGTIPLFQADTRSAEVGLGAAFFFQAIPYNFYAIFAVLLTLLVSLEVLPWFGRRMREASKRAKTTGQLDRPGAAPMTSSELTTLRMPENYRTGLIDFFGPIGTLMAIAVLPYIWFFVIRGDRNFQILIAEAFGMALVAGFIIALAKGMPLKTVMAGFIDGCKGVTIGALILALAITLKEVGDVIGTAEFVTGTLGERLPAAVLPALFLLLCMVTAFSTGTSFGTYAILFPIALPLAWQVNSDEFFITLCFASIVGGSLFGDQCSPISDTTILSSLGTGCDLMDHVRTQLPLALVAAGFAAFLYVVLAWLF